MGALKRGKIGKQASLLHNNNFDQKSYLEGKQGNCKKPRTLAELAQNDSKPILLLI